MTDEEIFDLAETHGWMDDFGRWNFKDEALIKFVLAIKTAEWVGLTEQDVHDAFQFTELIKQLSFDRERPEWCENFAAYLEAKLKEKNV